MIWNLWNLRKKIFYKGYKEGKIDLWNELLSKTALEDSGILKLSQKEIAKKINEEAKKKYDKN